MFCTILLKNCSNTLVIPADWIQEGITADDLKFGFRTHVVRKVFYSKNPDARPNFFAPILHFVDLNKDACYYGYILKTHGKKFVFFKLICFIRVFFKNNSHV